MRREESGVSKQTQWMRWKLSATARRRPGGGVGAGEGKEGWGREGWEGSGGRPAGAGQGGGVCAGQRSAAEVGGSVDKF